MKRVIRIGLKREILRDHLSREYRCAVTDSQLDTWLHDSGFKHWAGDEWLVQERDLGQLDPSEVATVEEVDPAMLTRANRPDLPPSSITSPLRP